MAKQKFILAGTTAQRPIVTTIGFEYFNTTTKTTEYWDGANWTNGVPNASPTIKGVVNQVPAVPNITTPAATTVEEANTQIQALSTKLNALLTAMRTAGIITP